MNRKGKMNRNKSSYGKKIDNKSEYMKSEHKIYINYISLVLKKLFWKSIYQSKQLTTFMRDVTFHKAYTRASPAECLGP